MGKKQLDYTERLIAPGKVDDWIDATEVALSYGTFEKIKLNHKGDQMRAQYGADDIVIGFRKKNASEVTLNISATDKKVLDWYKACVADVVCHPQNYSDYYAGTPKGNAGDKDYPADDGYEKPKFYTKTWFMILMMIVLPPAGIYLFFKYHRGGLVSSIVITAILVFYTLFVWLGFFGLNTGFGLTTIKGWFGDAKNATEPKVQVTERSSEPEEPVEYVGE